ncbi:hypothetical protein [Sphingomonas sp. 28-62-11]|uniref:hypothetical protein n=1 Tax=Sphingomonas sp. 28-62-11 TaxID=1970432 RepID=UPI000BD23907|nr:MAG: hypothetical protein B7Y49_01925 [Sphingomonas sp. 28-62-11]
MMLALLLLLPQVNDSLGPPSSLRSTVVTTPLKPATTRSCPEKAASDIVVCGSPDQNEQYRLRPLPPKYVEDPRIVVPLGGKATATSAIEQGRLGDGRIMFKMLIPF